jgi:hypothetical protein
VTAHITSDLDTAYLFGTPNLDSYHNLFGPLHSQQRGLMFVFAIVNGISVKLLVDSGCSMQFMLDTQCSVRIGVKQAKGEGTTDITVGDGHVIPASFGQKATVCVNGYQTVMTPRIISLSGEFDGVLGKPWLEGIERVCVKPPVISFVHNTSASPLE